MDSKILNKIHKSLIRLIFTFGIFSNQSYCIADIALTLTASIIDGLIIVASAWLINQIAKMAKDEARVFLTKMKVRAEELINKGIMPHVAHRIAAVEAEEALREQLTKEQLQKTGTGGRK